MQRTCDALGAVGLKDKDWRIMYLSATGFCLEDDKQNKAASDAIKITMENKAANLR